MPQIASAKKRVRVTARQTEENRLHRSRSRTALKKVRDLVAAGKVKEAAAEVAQAQSYLDKTAKSGAWHANTVARYKANLAAALKAAGNKDVIPGRKVAAVKPAAKKAASPKKSAAAKKAAPKAAAKTTKKASAKK